MYVYLLHSVGNRLAREGEELVVGQLDNGSLAFVAQRDLAQIERKKESIWADFFSCLLFRTSANISTIRIPAGAHLLLRNVPLSVQESLRLGHSEEVIFSEISGRGYSYRDALILSNQTRVLVEDLCKGIEATVLCLSPDTPAADEELHSMIGVSTGARTRTSRRRVSRDVLSTYANRDP